MKFIYSSTINQQIDTIIPCNTHNLHEVLKSIDLNNVNFEAKFASYATHYLDNGRKIYLTGLGEEKHSTKIEEAFKALAFDTSKYWGRQIQLNVDRLSENEVLKAAIGLKLSEYSIGKYKTTPDKINKTEVVFVSKQDISDIIQEGYETAKTINRIKTLVDAPPNVKTPDFLAKWAKDSAATHSYTCKVFEENELNELGFKALLSVGQASINKPVAIVTEYKSKNSEAIDLAIVGKGITFDSGGLSIKPSTNLHYMKSDMGGASVVLGLVELVAKLKLNINLIGVVVSAENAVGSNAYRPGDVIDSYSGKTIEVIDTDAEGRLALADGISYVIDKYNPNTLIDIATLTGSVVRTFGYSAAGLFSNNTELSKALESAGNKVHERVWPLPLWEDYEEDLHSDVADIRNFNGKPIAGAINAAKFLEAFTEEHKNWVHLDIAGVAFGSSKYAKMKSASGYGIQLLTTFIKEYF